MSAFVLNFYISQRNNICLNYNLKNLSFYFPVKKIIYTNKKHILKNTMCQNNQTQDSMETWEIDFFSRPVVGGDGKKIWELIVVDKNQTFEHIEVIPNGLVNSKELKKRIKKLIETKTIKPKTIKFFRSQMFNMITIALSDLDLVLKPSRRTFALFKKILEREENVYPKMDGYKPFMRDSQNKEVLRISPEKMPDTLKGDMYAFASIETSNAISILDKNSNKKCFYGLPFEFIKSQNIPGVIIYSDRAKSLANWLDSLELFNVFCDIESRNIVIECGLDTQYLFGKLSDEQFKEAIFFEKSKLKAGGVHFISIQKITDKNNNLGFWLLNSQI